MFNTKRRQEKTDKDLTFNFKATSEYFEKKDENEPKILTKLQQDFLDSANKIALNSTMLHKHGAIIVYKNKIIAEGFNYRCNYLSKEYSIHAEIAALNNVKGKYKKILNECTMYVVRNAMNFDNVLKYSKPCDNCKKAILKYNLKKIYYSTNYEYDNLTSPDLY